MPKTADSPHLPQEKLELLRWLLPADRPGYDIYFKSVQELTLLGTGRWGPGDYILGPPGDEIDLTGPMERVFAFGNIMYVDGSCSITVHENTTGQIEIQFATTGITRKCVPDDFTNRYCYSYWRPGAPAPKSGSDVRETVIDHETDLVLAISKGDERIWLHHGESGVNHLVPHMKFHNELMRQSGLREKDQVFNPKLVMQQDRMFSDAVLRATLIAYNKVWAKVELSEKDERNSPQQRSFFRKFFNRS